MFEKVYGIYADETFNGNDWRYTSFRNKSYKRKRKQVRCCDAVPVAVLVVKILLHQS